MLKKNASYYSNIDTKINFRWKHKYRENKTIERQAAFSQAKWVTHITKTGYSELAVFCQHHTHVEYSYEVGGWSPAVFPTPWNMLCSPKPQPPQLGNIGSYLDFFKLSFICLYLFWGKIYIQFSRKSRKRHMPLGVTLETDNSTKEVCRWEAWCICMCVQGSGQSLWPQWQTEWTVHDKCAGNILSYEQATIHSKQLQKHCMSYSWNNKF